MQTGSGTFAIVILENKDLGDDGVDHEEVYGDFIKEVGSWSLAIEGLQDEVSRVVAGGSRKNRVHDISLAYNVAYDYSSAAAHAFAERDSSDLFFIGAIQKKASLLGQSLYKDSANGF